MGCISDNYILPLAALGVKRNFKKVIIIKEEKRVCVDV